LDLSKSPLTTASSVNAHNSTANTNLISSELVASVEAHPISSDHASSGNTNPISSESVASNAADLISELSTSNAADLISEPPIALMPLI
jgi:hypothetical protein